MVVNMMTAQRQGQGSASYGCILAAAQKASLSCGGVLHARKFFFLKQICRA